MLKKFLNIFKIKENKKIEVSIKEEPPEPKEVDIEITVIGNFIKVDIKEDCTVMEYVSTMKKRGQEWIEDKIPNATLFDKGVNIRKKVIYLFEKDNIRYSCYSNDAVIFINERITTKNNHIDERRITIYKNDDNYVINRLKHDQFRSTYYVKSHKNKNPDFSYFQLGKENAIELEKEVLANLEKIPGIETIIDLDLIYDRLGLEHKKTVPQVINPIKNIEENANNKVKTKK